jgi:hypothetical protein
MTSTIPSFGRAAPATPGNRPVLISKGYRPLTQNPYAPAVAGASAQMRY